MLDISLIGVLVDLGLSLGGSPLTLAASLLRSTTVIGAINVVGIPGGSGRTGTGKSLSEFLVDLLSPSLAVGWISANGKVWADD